jgi:hypothetical protein
MPKLAKLPKLLHQQVGGDMPKFLAILAVLAILAMQGFAL